MTIHHFRDWKPQSKTEHLVNIARRLLEDDPRQTVRQVFYALVRDGVVAGNDAEFKKLTRALTEARMSGRLDWDLLPDTHPGRILQRGESGVEVWVERDSLLLQTVQALQDLDVSVVTFRAYPSTSVLWAAVQRGVKTLLVPGDDTPRGEDVAWDLGRRLSELGSEVKVVRISAVDDIESVTPEAYSERLRDELKTEGVGEATPGASNILTATELERLMAEVGETTRASSLKAKIREALA